MPKSILAVAFLAVFFALLLLFPGEQGEIPLPPNPQRIISLSPAITDSLCYLGCSGRIAGVTDSDRLLGKKKIASAGKFRELNIEAILAAKPDLVILPADMRHFGKLLASVNLPVLLFDTGTPASFCKSLAELAKLCPAKNKAANLIADLSAPAPFASKSPTLLFGILNPGDCQIFPDEITIIGNDGFYNELISKTGAKNIYQGTLPYPRLTYENISLLNPDIVIFSAPDSRECQMFETGWSKKTGLAAKPKIFFEYDFTIPGPSAARTLEKLRKTVRDWSSNHG